MSDNGVFPDVHTFNLTFKVIQREDSRSKDYKFHSGYVEKTMALLSEMKALGIGQLWTNILQSQYYAFNDHRAAI